METSAFRFRRVWVLGSGFSKSFQPAPTLKDLTEALFAEMRPEFLQLTEFCHEFLSACNHQRQYQRIEEIATIILGRTIFRDEEERLRFSHLRLLFLK